MVREVHETEANHGNDGVSTARKYQKCDTQLFIVGERRLIVIHCV